MWISSLYEPLKVAGLLALIALTWHLLAGRMLDPSAITFIYGEF